MRVSSYELPKAEAAYLTIVMMPTHPSTRQVRMTAWTIALWGFSLLAQASAWGQGDCAQCEPSFSGTDSISGCPGEIDSWAFAPEAVASCSPDAPETHFFTEDLREGWTHHSAVTSLGLGPDGAIRLYGMVSLGYADSDYFIETEPLHVEELPSGRIRVTGEVANALDPDNRWLVHLVLTDAQPAAEWLEESLDHELVLAYDCTTDTASMSTFVLDPAHSHLSHVNGPDAGFLRLSHMPVNGHRRFQLGIGGSSHNCGLGLGGWFAWEGQINGTPVLGTSGDLIVDLTESEVQMPACGDPVGLAVTTAFLPCGTGASVTTPFVWADEEAPEMTDLTCPADTTLPGVMPASIDGLAWLGEPVGTWQDNCSPALDTDLQFADQIVTAGNCTETGEILRTIQWTATDACGLTSLAQCEQHITFAELPAMPGINFPSDTTVNCDATAPTDLVPILDACGQPLAFETTDVIGPPAIVLEQSFAADFNDCNLNGFVAGGGTTAVTEDGFNGTCGVTLAQFVGMVPNNFYPNVDPIGFGSYTVKARTNSLTADVLVKLFAGPGLISPALVFSIRPSGSDNPGVNVLGYGLQAATTAPPVFAEEWFDVQIDVTPGGVALSLNDVLWWTAPLPADLPASGAFKLGGFGSATFDDMAFVPYVACPNEYTIARTWTATDAAGNMMSQVQNISVVDELPPVLAADHLVWPCGAAMPTLVEAGLIWSDCGDVDIAFSDSLLSEVNGCGAATGQWLRTYTATDACGNTSEIEQVIDRLDTIPPVATTSCSIASGDTIVVCPDAPDWATWTNCDITWADNCTAPENLIVTDDDASTAPVSVCSFSDPAPLADGEDCDGFVSHGMRLFNLANLPGGEFYHTLGGTLATLPDGSLQMTGSFENMDLPPGEAGFALEAAYGPGLTWSEWQAQEGDPGYLYSCFELPDLHETWMYHIMDSATLTGWGAYAGTQLTLYHQPPNGFYGLQVGEGASSKNAENGFVAWFTFEGEAAGQTVNGSGDFFADLACGDSWTWTRTATAEDCAGQVSSFSYTLQVHPGACNPPEAGLTSSGPAAADSSDNGAAEATFGAEAEPQGPVRSLQVAVSPNPTAGPALVCLHERGESDLPFVLNVFNAQGASMNFTLRGTIPAAGEISVPIPGADWPAGMYTIVVETAGGVESRVWFKTR